MRYKVLKKNSFQHNDYSLLPLRREDIYLIKDWRNDQTEILRQKGKLSDEQQLTYYNNIIEPLFEKDVPEQLLFSFFYKENLIGYGGLVHIDWESRRAEISFLLETVRNSDVEQFQEDFLNYLTLIKEVAFGDLDLSKINTEAYDVRRYLYKPLELSGFIEESRIKSHNLINGRWVDTVFHSFYSRSYIKAVDKCFNVLVTSISRKVPMLNAVKNALDRLPTKSKLFGGDIDDSCIGKYFVDCFWKMPSLSQETLHEIVDFCIKNSIKLIIPSRDQELSFWSINKFFFEKSGIKIMVSDLDAINCTLDKLAFYKRGQQLGYPVITTSLTIADIDSSSLVVKERFGAGAQSLGLNLSKTEAAKHASTLSESIFQPFISGSEYSIDIYLNLQGKLKGSVCRKREKISHGESQITITENIPELEMICTSFAKQLNLVGHCLFQVLIDNNGAFHIVECNPRFGGASALSIFVGLDSFFWLISESQGLFNELEFIKPDKPVKQIRYNCDKIAYS